MNRTNDDINIFKCLAVQLAKGQMLDAGIAVSISFHRADTLAAESNVKFNALDLYVVDNVILIDLDLEFIGLVLHLIAVVGQLGVLENIGVINNGVAAVYLVILGIKHITAGRSYLMNIVIGVGQEVVIKSQLAVSACSAGFKELFAAVVQTVLCPGQNSIRIVLFGEHQLV